MRTLIVDIGNTRAKIAIYADVVRESQIVAVDYTDLDSEALRLCAEHGIGTCMISSVGNPSIADSLESALSIAGVRVAKLTPQSPVPSCLGPIHAQLGADRLAAVVAAVTEFPGSEIMVVDAGTAVTYEYISSEGRYYGGNISPGLTTRFRSLHEFTSLLPMVSAEDYAGPVGFSTKSAIAAGVLDGFRYEIAGAIDAFMAGNGENGCGDEEKSQKKIVILTGGDHKYLVLKVKSCIFARPNLVLDGAAVVATRVFGTHFD